MKHPNLLNRIEPLSFTPSDMLTRAEVEAVRKQAIESVKRAEEIITRKLRQMRIEPK